MPKYAVNVSGGNLLTVLLQTPFTDVLTTPRSLQQNGDCQLLNSLW
jgi:hypothetical protein